MERLPQISALRSFVVAARCLSFTQAAAELNVTQGAVSHQVKGLEELLGVKLFHREHQSLRLTESGQAYLPFVREAIDRLKAGADHLSARERSGVLTVSVSPNFASKWLVNRMGAFNRSHSDIDLRITASMQHVDFDSNDVEMAVRHGHGNWPNLHVTKLTREEIFPVCSPEFLRSAPGLQMPQDLKHVTLLNDTSRNDWPLWFAAAGLDSDDIDWGPSFDQTNIVIDAAIAGQGVALARSALAAHDIRTGKLVRLFNVSLPAPYGYFVVGPKATAAQDKIVRFREWLVREAEGDRIALAGNITTPV